MLVAEQSLALQETIQQMGYDSVEAFALVNAKERLFAEIVHCTKNIESFENKYGLDYAHFCMQFQQLKQPLFEKEEDGAEWNAELKQISILQKRLARLA